MSNRIGLGQRVEVLLMKNSKERGERGTVAYVGSTVLGPGKRIGVMLDEGNKVKTNGTVLGNIYFTAWMHFKQLQQFLYYSLYRPTC